jgi:hypothetical protein
MVKRRHFSVTCVTSFNEQFLEGNVIDKGTMMKYVLFNYFTPPNCDDFWFKACCSDRNKAAVELKRFPIFPVNNSKSPFQKTRKKNARCSHFFVAA